MELRDQVVAKIKERASMLYGVSVDELTDDTRFIEDLGAKSGNVSQMTTFLEDEFDIEIPFMPFRRKPTIGEAADFVADLMDE